MDINRIYEFIALSRTLNYSRAAQELFITQPVLSRHIADMERALGAPLFTRDTHQVRLTSAGRLFVRDAQRIIDKYEKAVARLHAAGLPERGSVAIAFLHSAVRDILADYSRTFSARYPEIELDFQALEMEDFMREFARGHVDVGFSLHAEGIGMEGVYERVVFRDRECLVVSKSHPLAQRREVDIRELEGEKFIFLSPVGEQNVRRHHQLILDKYLNSYTISKEATNVESALFFVEMNKGIMLLPRHRVFIAGRNTAAIDITNPECLLEIVMYWRENSSNPAAKLFVEEFEYFRKRL